MRPDIVHVLRRMRAARDAAADLRRRRHRPGAAPSPSGWRTGLQTSETPCVAVDAMIVAVFRRDARRLHAFVDRVAVPEILELDHKGAAPCYATSRFGAARGHGAG